MASKPASNMGVERSGYGTISRLANICAQTVPLERDAPVAPKKCCAQQGGFASPLEAMRSGQREEIAYVAVGLNEGRSGGGKLPDYLATVDVNPESPSYSTVVHRLPMPTPGDELHHMGWNACSSCRDRPGAITHNYLVAPGLFSGNIHFIDVKTDARAPRLLKTITGEEIGEKLGTSMPHTTHCAPAAIMVSMMGSAPDAEGNISREGSGFAAIDPESLEILGRWEAGCEKPCSGNDFWYQPRQNVMVSTGFGDPESFTRGFNPAHVAEGKYAQHLYVWDWHTHRLVQKVDCGLGSIPLEVRFLHDPTQAVGYMTCALSGEIRRFFRRSSGCWDTEIAVRMEAVSVEGWALPDMPALPTDIVISMDDRFLFVSNWIQGDVRMYDLTVTPEPRLVGQVYVGGSMKKGGPVRRTDGGEQPEALVVKGVEVQGGAHMLQLALDGQRLYVTTSLFSVWDQQFYPEMVAKGNQMVQLDVDTERGGLRVNPGFLVDFGAEPFGPGRGNEMRLPGGDCTSDIWV